MNTTLILYSSIFGILPALIWLWFWLKEDSVKPEPKKIIVFTFIGGMIAVIPTIALQLYVDSSFIPWLGAINDNLASILLWGGSFFTIAIHATIEEIMKFSSSVITALRTKANDEPIDPIIYLITTALGFVAVENTLFIISSYLNGGIISSLIIGNIRFVGASLLHVTSSAIIGISLALVFHKKWYVRVSVVSLGIILGVALHTYFNFLIINKSSGFLLSFPLVWTVVVAVVIVTEKIKRLKYY